MSWRGSKEWGTGGKPWKTWKHGVPNLLVNRLGQKQVWRGEGETVLENMHHSTPENSHFEAKHHPIEKEIWTKPPFWGWEVSQSNLLGVQQKTIHLPQNQKTLETSRSRFRPIVFGFNFREFSRWICFFSLVDSGHVPFYWGFEAVGDSAGSQPCAEKGESPAEGGGWKLKIKSENT